MPTILDFHIQLHKEGGYSLEIFARCNPKPLAQTTFVYDLSYITQFEINRLECDLKDPAGRLERASFSAHVK